MQRSHSSSPSLSSFWPQGMSDGWDELTAYGHHAGGGALRIHARNSGMFFIQARQPRPKHRGTPDHHPCTTPGAPLDK